MNRLKRIEHILKTMPTIAVVGLSSQPSKAGFYVPKYMQKHGYRIVPVNPYLTTALGELAYPTLESIPFAVDVVQIFRQPQFVPPFVEDAIAVGAKAVWLQRDITFDNGPALAEQAGITYVQNRCMMVEHRHLVQYGWTGKPKLLAN